ncbi:hypothetical protein [Polyangium sp. 15x6]|uniref:hypothetical protein n=1 Tax=Polyangium sp. 15x6 TaxID=3042687 RepID=UPI00249BC39F|nr:hypothetical protein [Polyangium sp. 15x6]MDI3287508.1 hypothetical protein [Polyangium sp. 15x6]
MNLTKRIGALAALFLAAAVTTACGNAVVSGGNGGDGGTGATNSGGGGSGGCQDPAQCEPSCPEFSLSLGLCSVEGQVCSYTDKCGYGPVAECTDGAWDITYYDPAGCGCDCEEPCPAEKPVHGSACDINYTGCWYPDPLCDGGGAEASCDGETWYVSETGYACQRTCPDTLPVDGTPCDACCSSDTCAYLDASGCPAQIACENGVWVSSPSSCTPTSACAMLDMNQCGNAQGCRWLAYPDCFAVQGGFPQGCYPVDGCSSDADCNGGTCEGVAVDPCPGADCNACQELAGLCLP